MNGSNHEIEACPGTARERSACGAAARCEAATRPLDIYFIDVEGGQSTLLVTPDKQSYLIDTG